MFDLRNSSYPLPVTSKPYYTQDIRLINKNNTPIHCCMVQYCRLIPIENKKPTTITGILQIFQKESKAIVDTIP